MLTDLKFDDSMRCRYIGKDLVDRLHDTLIRYKGEPVYVNVKAGDTLELWDIATRSKNFGRFKSDDPDIDISQMEIGYLNHTSQYTKGKLKVFYLYRTPMRQYRQGLHYRNVVTSDIERNIISRSDETLIYTQSFWQSIMGIYPSWDEAVECVTSGKMTEVAVSQDIAIRRTKAGPLLLFLRGVNVGWIAPDENKVRLVNDKIRWVVERNLSRLGIQVQ